MSPRGVRIWVSRHAAERFQERVRPALTVRQASIELARLCREHGERCTGPPWRHSIDREPDFWVRVAPEVYVACARGRPGRWATALTVLTKTLPPTTRERRNHHRQVAPPHRSRTLAERDRPSGRRSWAPSIELED